MNIMNKREELLDELCITEHNLWVAVTEVEIRKEYVVNVKTKLKNLGKVK